MMRTSNAAQKISYETTPVELVRVDSPEIRPTTWLLGFGGYSLFAWIYDYLGYGLAIWLLGPLFGGLFMAVLTIPVDLYCLKLYDWSQTDWFAIEYIKAVRAYRGPRKLKRVIGKILSVLPNWALVVLLAVKFNAFIITALLRDGAYSYNSMTTKDWINFWYSSAICQIYWIAVVALGVEGIKIIAS